MAKKTIYTQEELQKLEYRIAKIRTDFCNDDNNLFAQRMGIARQTASNICTGNKKAGNKTLQKLLSIFPEVNGAWLILGEGPMLKNGNVTGDVNVCNSTMSSNIINSPSSTIGAIQTTPSEKVGGVLQSVPCLPAGIYKMEHCDCIEYIKTHHVHRVNISESFGKIDLLYTVRDHSMEPEFILGDMVGLRRISPGTPVINGNIYVVDTKDNGVVMRCVHDLGDGRIELVPIDQKRYRPNILNTSDIYHIFSALFLVRAYL